MTPLAQRIAIAEACGIIVRSDLSGYCNDHRGCADWNVIPDYLSDLNAMHEAEKVLTIADWINYTGYLHQMFLERKADVVPFGGVHSCIHATAAQRAEAFLRTLNLWKD